MKWFSMIPNFSFIIEVSSFWKSRLFVSCFAMALHFLDRHTGILKSLERDSTMEKFLSFPEGL